MLFTFNCKIRAILPDMQKNFFMYADCIAKTAQKDTNYLHSFWIF